MQAAVVLPNTVGQTVALRVDAPGGGNTLLQTTRVDAGTLRVDSFSRVADQSTAAQQTIGRIQPEQNRLTINAASTGAGSLVTPTLQVYANPDGDLFLKDADQALVEDTALLGKSISAVGDLLKSGVETATLLSASMNFWKTYATMSAETLATVSRKTAEQFVQEAKRTLPEIIDQLAVGSNYTPELFRPNEPGEIPLGTLGDFSDADLLTGDGRKRLGLIDQTMRHVNFIYQPAATGLSAIADLADGAQTIGDVWDAAAGLKAIVDLRKVYEDWLDAYKANGERRVLSNIIKYVREVEPTSATYVSSKLRDAILRDMKTEALFTTTKKAFDGLKGITSGGIAADQAGMLLLKLSAESDLLKQLQGANGEAKVLLQDLIVEMLAEHPTLGPRFLQQLSKLDVWTYERSGWIFKSWRVVKLPGGGAVRYGHLLGAGK